MSLSGKWWRYLAPSHKESWREPAAEGKGWGKVLGREDQGKEREKEAGEGEEK